MATAIGITEILAPSRLFTVTIERAANGSDAVYFRVRQPR